MTIIFKTTLRAAIRQYYLEQAEGLDPVELMAFKPTDRLDKFRNYIVGRAMRRELISAAEAYAYCERDAPQLWAKGKVDLDAFTKQAPQLKRFIQTAIHEIETKRNADVTHITANMLFEAVGALYTAQIPTGQGVDFHIGKELHAYVHLLPAGTIRMHVRDLSRNWLEHAKAHMGAIAGTYWIDLDALCEGNAEMKNLVLDHLAPHYFLQIKRKFDSTAKPAPDSPLNEPVVAWLIETLKPSTILWSTDDPIFDVLQSVCKHGSRWVNSDEARETAVCLALLHNKAKSKATPPVKPEIGFFDAVARLKAVSGTDNILDFTDRLRAEFGESFYLTPDEIVYTAAPRVVLMRISKSRGIQRVLWASTRAAVYRDMNAIGEVFDFTNEDNMQHLLKCYNAHTKQQPLGETMPCSHFPSRNN